MKPSSAANDNLKTALIERTRLVWQPRIGRDLKYKDAREIAENAVGFFAILAEWSRAAVPPPANDTGKPSAPSTAQVLHDR